jgi:hypothetical protein
VRRWHLRVPFLETARHAQPPVIPAKAGIHSPVRSRMAPERQPQWIPAFAGMTV